MPQTSYNRGFSAPSFAGALGDTGPQRVGSYLNNAGANLPAGVFVKFSAEATSTNLGASTDKIAGVVVNSAAHNPNGLTGANDAILAGDTMNVLEEGAVWVRCEEAMAVGDSVFARFASGAGGTVMGYVRNDADTASCMQLKGARVLVPATAAGICMVYFSASVQGAF
jgi:hypothetical protein